MVNPSDVLAALKILISPDTTKLTTGNKDNDRRQSSQLDELLCGNMQELQNQLHQDSKLEGLLQLIGENQEVTTVDSEDIRWNFVLWNLKILCVLKTVVENAMKKYKEELKYAENSSDDNKKKHPSMAPDTLSFNQQRLVLTSMQFIVCLGICPCLLPGVGLPVERRSEFANLLQNNPVSLTIGQRNQEECLILCLRVLVGLIQQPSLGSLILSRHLGDILAGLCQVCFAPRHPKSAVKTQKKSKVVKCQKRSESGLASSENTSHPSLPTRNEEEHLQSETEMEASKTADCTTDDPYVSQDTARCTADRPSISTTENADLSSEVASTTEEKIWCEEQLNALLDRVYQPMVVRALMILQGGSGSQSTKQAPSSVLSRSPVWLRKHCGRLLSERLMRPSGLLCVLRGMLDSDAGGAERAVPDWRKCDAIAKIIAQSPSGSQSVDHYYKIIASQVIDLLHIRDKLVARQFLRVAVSTVIAMATRQPELAKQYILEPLLQPLNVCLQHSVCDKILLKCLSHLEVGKYILLLDLAEDQLGCLVSEDDLALCVEDIHKIYVSGAGPPTSPFLESLGNVIHVLFKLYCFTKNGVSHLRLPVEEILTTFLKGVDESKGLSFLQFLTFGYVPEVHDDVTSDVMSSACSFAIGPTGGVLILHNGHSRDESLDDLTLTSTCIVDLLQKLQRDGLAAEFFLLLLKDLTMLVAAEVEPESDSCRFNQVAPSSVRSTTAGTANAATDLLEIEDQQDRVVDQLKHNLIVLTLLATMSDNLGQSCFKSTSHILQFVKVTLEREIKVLQYTEDEAVGVFESETLSMAMSLLTAVMSQQNKMQRKDREKTEELLPLLESIEQSHSDTSLREMAADLRIAIATHGVIWSDAMKSATGNVYEQCRRTGSKCQEVLKNSSRVKPKTKPLIEVVPSQSTDSKVKKNMSEQKNRSVPEHRPTQKDDASSEQSKEGGCLSQALQELCDSEIPIRGHGLISLRRLVQEGDKDALEKLDQILEIFRKNLEHPDSYIYLAAVHGLASVGERAPSRVLPVLLVEFASLGQKVTRSTESRMKLGEVIVRVSRSLGETIPRHRDVLLNSLLSGAKDADHMVRASSLSNLGDVCKMLRFSLGNIINEIFDCVSSLLMTDKEAEVRKAAAMLITFLLQGLGRDVVKMMDTLLKEVYNLLKRSMLTEKDQMVRVHVQLALNQLEDIMKELLFPPQTLTKTIRVLHPE